MALKLGTEDKKKVYIVTALGVILLFVFIFEWGSLKSTFGFGASAPAPPPPVAQPALPVPGPATAKTGAHDATKLANTADDLDPTLHPELMAQAESLEYTGTGRNIFSLTSAPIEIPKPIVSPRAQTQVAQGPPPPAPPPAIDLKFFGFSTRKSGLRRAFLLKGDDVFVASEGEVVDHRYKVVKIAPTSIQVEDIPYANTQSLPLAQN